MNSFNHYAYGAIGDWMYRVAAGIDTYESDPGYKKIMIKPHTGGKLDYVSADLETYYGKISSHWKQQNGQFILDVEIPANTQAEIFIPASATEVVKEGGVALSAHTEIKVLRQEDNYTVVKAGSGIYHFEVN